MTRLARTFAVVSLMVALGVALFTLASWAKPIPIKPVAPVSGMDLADGR